MKQGMSKEASVHPVVVGVCGERDPRLRKVGIIVYTRSVTGKLRIENPKRGDSLVLTEHAPRRNGESAKKQENSDEEDKRTHESEQVSGFPRRVEAEHVTGHAIVGLRGSVRLRTNANE